MSAKDITIKGNKAKRGERMTSGRGYRLVTKGNRVACKGSPDLWGIHLSAGTVSR